MPELPEIAAYLHALEPRVRGATLEKARVRSVSLLKTWDPPLDAATGREVTGLARVGKRIALALEGDLHLVLHLMIAGRLQWREEPWGLGSRNRLAALDFSTGSLLLTEAGTKRRAALHLVRGADALAALDPGGVEPLEADLAGFRGALLRERHTLKRALTDPRAFAGIGGAWADEILHRARLSPLQLNVHLDDGEIARLREAAREVLARAVEIRLRETGKGFPGKITAFHPDMAVHGKYGDPCPACGSPVQRIVYADRETNYCPTCQTDGRVLADRALSRLLREDWPRTVEEWEALHRGRDGE